MAGGIDYGWGPGVAPPWGSMPGEPQQGIGLPGSEGGLVGTGPDGRLPPMPTAGGLPGAKYPTGGGGGVPSNSPAPSGGQTTGGGGGIYGPAVPPNYNQTGGQWWDSNVVGGYNNPGYGGYSGSGGVIGSYDVPNTYLLGQQFGPYAQMQAAQTEAGAQRDVASTQAGASRYGSDAQLKAAQAAADATQYGSDKSLAGTQYSADKNLAGTGLLTEAQKYGADQGLAGINSQVKGQLDLETLKQQLAREKMDKLLGLVNGQNGQGGLLDSGLGDMQSVLGLLPKAATAKFNPMTDQDAAQMASQMNHSSVLQHEAAVDAMNQRLGNNGLMAARPGQGGIEKGIYDAREASDMGRNAFNARQQQLQTNVPNALAYSQQGIAQRAQDAGLLGSALSGRNQLKNTMLGGLLAGLA